MATRRDHASGDAAPDSSRRRARKGEGELLREEILDAAEALLVEKGHPDGVSIRAIARRVGVSPPAIYLHFADKDELFFQCCFRHFEEMAARLAVAALEHESALDRLEAVGRAYMEFGVEKGEHYVVMFVSPTPKTVTGEESSELPGTRALALTADLVAAGVASGELRAELDPLTTAVSLWAAAHGTVMVLLSAHEKAELDLPSAQEVIDGTIALVRRGLRA